MLDRSPLDHPMLLRWTLEAREEAVRRDLREGDRVRHAHSDLAGRILRESLERPGMVLISWDGGSGSLEEPWDLEPETATRGIPRGRPVVTLEDLLAWADEKGLKPDPPTPKSGACRS